MKEALCAGGSYLFRTHHAFHLPSTPRPHFAGNRERPLWAVHFVHRYETMRCLICPWKLASSVGPSFFQKDASFVFPSLKEAHLADLIDMVCRDKNKIKIYVRASLFIQLFCDRVIIFGSVPF